jgi:hypothetical protein
VTRNVVLVVDARGKALGAVEAPRECLLGWSNAKAGALAYPRRTDAKAEALAYLGRTDAKAEALAYPGRWSDVRVICSGVNRALVEAQTRRLPNVYEIISLK